MSIFVFNQIKQKFSYKKNSRKVFAVLLSKKEFRSRNFFFIRSFVEADVGEVTSEAKSLSIYSDRLGLSRRRSPSAKAPLH